MTAKVETVIYPLIPVREKAPPSIAWFGSLDPPLRHTGLREPPPLSPTAAIFRPPTTEHRAADMAEPGRIPAK